MPALRLVIWHRASCRWTVSPTVLHTNLPTTTTSLCVPPRLQQRKYYSRSRDPQVGLATPVPDETSIPRSRSPFFFEVGYAGWSKRAARPFPPPFFSPPSGSFSDPLSTHDRSRISVDGQMIRGVTNGDDAMLASETLIGTNDGVGAWATRERGYAPLWSRLILHYLAVAAEDDQYGGAGKPDPVRYLNDAYEKTKEVLSEPNAWLGTTTASSALLHFAGDAGSERPVLYITQLGDCKIMVIRPADGQVLFSSQEQWHYFDCPRQLGTNSPDTPDKNAVLSNVEIHEDDLVLAMSDGVIDNMWDEEICERALTALSHYGEQEDSRRPDGTIKIAEAMRYVAQEVVLAARKVAEDPYAASPFMEKAVDEGLAIEGGKPDDISVVAATCRRRKG